MVAVNYGLKSEYFEKYEALKKFWPIREAELHGESARKLVVLLKK